MWKTYYISDMQFREELYEPDKDEFIPVWEYLGAKDDYDVYRSRKTGDIVRFSVEETITQEDAAEFAVNGTMPEPTRVCKCEVYDGSVYSDDRWVTKVWGNEDNFLP